jgi:indolepyruvate ferredoxin oxidoreductase alpha subunit
VAADAFINSAITGINGGLVITVADDPSMHSSQNEQDSRFYGKFAMIPILEPSNQQEAYDMTRHGLELSEETGLPVMLRITTRLAHSRSGIIRRKITKENKLQLPEDSTQFILLPANARKRYKVLLDKQNMLKQLTENSKYNFIKSGTDNKTGIIACGIGYNYLMENFNNQECPYPVLRISQYPIPEKLIAKMEESCEEILILEEGYPFVEEAVRGIFSKKMVIRGRLNGSLPRDGELNPDIVAKALGKKVVSGPAIPGLVVGRPPALCQGCGHKDMFKALNEVMTKYTPGRVFSDIGCYTLGALPPYKCIYSCVDMGASITMAKGASDAGLIPSLAVIGDSTFTHSGITGLLDAVNDNANIVVIISDNEAVSMTGGQDSSALGKIESVCAGVGVDPAHIKVLIPLPKNHEAMVKTIEEEIDFQGVSVIIFRRECIQAASRRRKKIN